MKTSLLQFIVLCGTFSAVIANGYTHYYVISSNSSSPCPNKNCKTLDYYATNQSRFFTSNTIFSFQSGTHFLNRTISIHNVKNVIFGAGIDLSEGIPIIQCHSGAGGLIFQNATSINLKNLSFAGCGQSLPLSLQRDGETAQAALAFGEVTDILLGSVSVSHSRGYGILGHCIHGNFTVTHSVFSFNKGSTQYLGGNAAIEYTNCSKLETKGPFGNLYIAFSNFSFGDYDHYCDYTNYTGTLATGLILILSQTNISVQLTDVVMESNTNDLYHNSFGGNLFIHFFNYTNFTSNKVTIENSKFVNGTGLLGAGISVSFYTYSSTGSIPEDCKNVLTIYNSTISHNKGILGSGMYVNFQSKRPNSKCPHNTLNVSNCTFESNAQIFIESQLNTNYLGIGVAAHIVSTYPNNQLVRQLTSNFDFIFEDTNFISNYLKFLNSTNNIAKSMGITFAVANNEVNIKNCGFISNEFTALSAYRGKIAFSGNITISNNTGINGGGLVLCESSYIYLSDNTTVSFTNNHALVLGGAIYTENECLHSKPYCFFQFTKNYYGGISQTVSIVMINNTAGYAGDHIYGGALDKCYINADHNNSTEVFKSLFSLHPNNDEQNPSSVTSYPRKICFCLERNFDCKNSTINYPEAVLPGDAITLKAVIVGQFDGAVPGTIYLRSQDAPIFPDVYTTNRDCTSHVTTIKTNKTDSITIEMHISTAMLGAKNSSNFSTIRLPQYVHVSLKQCPLGFSHSNDICECDERLIVHKHIQCIITNQTVLRNPPAWIGYNNESDGAIYPGMVYHKVCPYDYCLDTPIYIASTDATFDQDLQCRPNRTGLLCGKCENGFSLSIGTSDCLICKTDVVTFFAIVGFLLIGILLVLFFIVFDTTYTEGTLSGLLFFVNVVNINSFIFLPSAHWNVATVIVSWMNVNFGFKSCFYNGMDSYAKSWFSFCFPTYLFLINMIIIALCKRSTKLANLFGGNIIKVLVTLFQLSYTKLIQSVVTVLSFTPIEYPSSNNSSGVYKLVWLFDPSLEYFSGKHIPLALVAIAFGLLILAHTLVLLFVQPLQRYSHWRCFSWVNKLKPLIDAYTAPHITKDNCRYWEGLLLLFRLLLAIAFTANIRSRIDINLTVVTLLSLLLLTIAWASGGVYKKTYLNILNSVSILNLAVLSTAVSNISAQNNSKQYEMHSLIKEPYYIITTSLSYGIASLIMVGILANRVYRKMKLWFLKCRRKKYQALPLDASNSLPPLRQFPND